MVRRTSLANWAMGIVVLWTPAHLDIDTEILVTVVSGETWRGAGTASAATTPLF